MSDSENNLPPDIELDWCPFHPEAEEECCNQEELRCEDCGKFLETKLQERDKELNPECYEEGDDKLNLDLEAIFGDYQHLFEDTRQVLCYCNVVEQMVETVLELSRRND